LSTYDLRGDPDFDLRDGGQEDFMTEKQKQKACAEWDAFAARCAEKPVEMAKPKPKKKGKK